MLSMKELKDAAERLGQIQQLQRELEYAQARMKLVNQYVKAGEVWKPTLCLKRGDHYTRDVEVQVTVPSGVVQQQAVYEVARIEREIIKLGGTP